MDFVGNINTAYDAFILVAAVLRGDVNVVMLRPNFRQCSAIFPGKTIIFNETVSGIKRWTDGKSWTRSRLKDGFFYYSEIKVVDKSSLSFLLNDEDGSEKANDALCKKTISVTTDQDHTYHIINYFNEKSSKTLTTPMNYSFHNFEELETLCRDFTYFKSFRATSRMYRQPIKITKLSLEYKIGSNLNKQNNDNSPNSLAISGTSFNSNPTEPSPEYPLLNLIVNSYPGDPSYNSNVFL